VNNFLKVGETIGMPKFLIAGQIRLQIFIRWFPVHIRKRNKLENKDILFISNANFAPLNNK